jgi:hypothetical protein
LQIYLKSTPLVRSKTIFLLPLLTKERVGVRFKELSTLIKMLPNCFSIYKKILNVCNNCLNVSYTCFNMSNNCFNIDKKIFNLCNNCLNVSYTCFKLTNYCCNIDKKHLKTLEFPIYLEISQNLCQLYHQSIC